MATARYIALVSLIACSPSWAVNKCVDAIGKISYQEQPCTTGANQIPANLPKSAPNPSLSSQSSFQQRSIQELQAVVSESLKDSNSAQFKDLRHVGDGRALCGKVNSRNSYGGYTGFRSFVADEEGVYWEGDGSAEVDIGRYEARRTFIPKSVFWQCLSR